MELQQKDQAVKRVFEDWINFLTHATVRLLARRGDNDLPLLRYVLPKVKNCFPDVVKASRTANSTTFPSKNL